MPILSAYITVIIIWSTTPLAIQWSGNGVGFEFGVALRMLIGLLILILIVRISHLELPWDSHHIRVYSAGGIPLFGAMTLVYWSAQTIPTGWISVIFGLTPLFTSLLAALILREKSFSAPRTLGMVLGLSGLVIVFSESLTLEHKAWLGVAAVCLASLLHSLSSVVLKKLKPTIHSIAVTTGSLMIATPLFIANSLVQGLPDAIPLKSLSAIVYLAIMGTAIGFPLYFYCLKNLHAQRVALITLITPVTALLLGAGLNDETISIRIWAGTFLILCGLSIYEYGKYVHVSRRWIRWIRYPF